MNTCFGLYIHVPFCQRKCAYCDFFSQKDNEKKTPYINALLREMEESRSYIDSSRLSTLYFGGGTPSLLSADDFKRIFEGIDRCFDRSLCKEITLEANPDDLDKHYIEALRQLPFNRISIGIQSFQENELQRIGRRHSAQQAIEAVKQCQDNGFENISIDLMFGLPEQTLESFENNIDTALSLHVQHISAYLLSLEPQVALYKSLKKGLWKAPDDELTEQMYQRLCSKLLSAGFEHYEISNFALPNFRSQHNSSYWNNIPYLGLGPSAHSYNGKNRRWNEASLKNYIQQEYRREEEILTQEMQYNEFILTRLRTKEGINVDYLTTHFGLGRANDCIQAAQKYIATGDVLLCQGYLSIAPKAYFISDEIIRDLMV